MTRRDPTITARTALNDLTAAVATIDHALRYISDTRTGYATSVPGSGPVGASNSLECPVRTCSATRPCPTHDSEPGPDTIVERTAFTVDRAANAHNMITLYVNRIAQDANHLRQLSVRWGTSGIDATEVRKSLAEATQSIYCDNCTKYGFSEVRREGGRQCDFCSRFANDYPPYQAPRSLIDIHTRRGRINSADIDRTMTTQHGPDWRKKLKKKPKGKVAA